MIDTISKIHEQAQAGAAGAVNRYLILRNWLIGAYIVEYEQKGKDRAEYGSGLMEKISCDLRARGVNGLGISMLKNCRQFYKIYPQFRQPAVGEFKRLGDDSAIRQSLISELDIHVVTSSVTEKTGPKPLSVESLFNFSWTHFIEFIMIEDAWKRAFYENECLKGNWSKRQLQRQIGSLLYERTGLSTDKKTVINAGRKQATEAPRVIAGLIRDPYVLEFTGLAELPQYHESTLEAALLNHLQSFLLELGNGFCFEARQKWITVGNEHDYIDPVFYHRILRCHLLIGLKVRSFRHGAAGQMNFYLNYWKEQMMQEGDNPPVGLILCTDKERTKVEYAVGGLDRKLFVSRYMVALPKLEEIKRFIENDRACWEQQQTCSKNKSDGEEVKR